MFKLLASLCLLLCLSGCSAGSSLKGKAYPNEQQLVGIYFWGDGFGANEVMELRADGTYRQTLLAHLTPGDVELNGRWQVREGYIYFYTSSGEYPARPDGLTRAEIFFYKKKTAFVREQDIRKGKVYESWVYKWQRLPDA
jgi:hypothetical protein